MFKAHHQNHDPSPEYQEACRQVLAAGFRISSGSWEDGPSYCVSSIETWGPATYNSPRMIVNGRSRSRLEQLAREAGYEPEQDDTDNDLEMAILQAAG